MKAKSKIRKKHQPRTLPHLAPQQSQAAARQERRWHKPDVQRIQPAAVPARAGFRWRWLILSLVALIAFGGTWAFCENVVWSQLPGELVGKWVVTEGPQEGATFDFYRTGTMVGKVNAGGQEAIVNARVRVEDKKIYSTTRNPNTGQDDTMVLVIRTLTARALVVEDGQGKLLKMERAE